MSKKYFNHSQLITDNQMQEECEDLRDLKMAPKKERYVLAKVCRTC